MSDAPQHSRNNLRLTNREIEILKLIGKGITNTEIGLELFISQRTVRAHIQSILQKLRARNRTEAVVKAIKLGFIKL